MKRLYTTGVWKEFNQKRSAIAQIKRRRRKTRTYSRIKEHRLHGAPRSLTKTTITFPETFSLVIDCESALKTLGEIRRLIQKQKPIFADLSAVKTITQETLVVLISYVSDQKKNYTVQGNVPRDPKAHEYLRNSGFFKFVDTKLQQVPVTTGEIAKKKGKKLNSELAESLVYRTHKGLKLPRATAKSNQRVILEMMSNTFFHASRQQGREMWYLSMNFDCDRKVISFAFFDNGVGIFKSRRFKFLKEKFNPSLNEPEILRRLFTKQLPSITGQRFRGKGLPAILKVVQRGKIENAKIFTYNVTGSLDNQTFEFMSNRLYGTLYYWEAKCVTT